HLTADRCRVRQRPDDVHHRWNSELAAHWTNVSHGGVHAWREHEHDASTVVRAPHCISIDVDADAQRFENVCTTRFGSEGSVAVFRYAHACASGNEGGSRGDVESPDRSATGPARVDDTVVLREIQPNHR